MKDTLTTEFMLSYIKNLCRVMELNENYLTALDSEIGDSEHGISMARGFRAVSEKLCDFEVSDVGMLLSTVGTVLIETVGGAAGPLFGTFFIRAGKASSKKNDIDIKDMAEMFEAGLMGVKAIGGGTKIGEKTMIDALEPAVIALKEAAVCHDRPLASALNDAVEAAKKGMIETINMSAKKGRAKCLGDRSRGHLDPERHRPISCCEQFLTR